MQNIELKLELRDPALAGSILRSLGATLAGVEEQTDTYFKIAHGRLKRREIAGEPPEFILYERRDLARPRASTFTIYSEAQAATRFGTSLPPVWVVVRKVREVYLRGHVRIHLDQVNGLGTFIEFEALVTPDCDDAACHAAVAELRAVLSPALGEPISTGYADLMAALA
jgi:adenylate cyclase, class 2